VTPGDLDSTTPTADLRRRDLLRLGALGLAGATLTACGDSSPADGSQTGSSARRGRRRILLVSFSRAGENYYYGGRRNLRVGNTQVPPRKSRSTASYLALGSILNRNGVML